MPTFTAAALDSFLETNTRCPPLKMPAFPSDEQSPRAPPPAAAAAAKKPSPPIQYIYPALYTTPEPASILSSSPTCGSPSPYVVNHKRRDFPQTPSAPPKASDRVDGSQGVSDSEDRSTGGNHLVEPLAEEVAVVSNGGGDENEVTTLLRIDGDGGGVVIGGNGSLSNECLGGDNDIDPDDGDFFDPRESMSVLSSNSDTEDGYSLGKCTPLKSRNEFYDAAEDFLSDSPILQSSSIPSNIEADLHAVRLNLFEETERRKKVEESLCLMTNQWQRIVNSLVLAGLLNPLDMQFEEDIAARVCQKVVVARFVSEAVERGVARAEAEAVQDNVIESKNREIARLRDRLQYYEAMNREMSQRNQQAIELARRQRRKRKLKQKWIWSCLGLSVSVGASLLAYSHFPQAGKSSLPPSDYCSDTSSCAIGHQGTIPQKSLKRGYSNFAQRDGFTFISRITELYTFLATVLDTFALLPRFIKFFGDAKDHSSSPGNLAITFLAFVLNLAFALSLLCFLVMHTSLLLSNTTTIEVYEKNKAVRWKYDMGRRENFEQVFGTRKAFWFFPLYSKEDLEKMPALQGLNFPTRSDVEG